MKIAAQQFEHLRFEHLSEISLARYMADDQIEITEELCRNLAHDVDWDWIARETLPPALLAEYERQYELLRDEYNRQRAPLMAEYERQCRLRQTAIEQQYSGQPHSVQSCESLLDERDRLFEKEWNEYWRLAEPLLAELRLQAAALFGRLAQAC